jgi:hypothetical protein
VRRATRRFALLAALGGLAALAAPSYGATRPTTTKPAFTTYHQPGEPRDEGEPSIGVDWKTGAALYQSGLETLKVTFVKNGATWQPVTPAADVVSLDPMLVTDGATGRTFVSQLAAGCSILSWSDDDGRTWQPSVGCGPGGGVDHQSIGVGPYPAGVTHLGAYPNAVYYCSQAIVDASCARSDDGGTTFGPAVPVYALTQCGGLHGQVRVGPDGTVYLPNAGCGNHASVVVSTDGGLTWTVRTVDGSSSPGESDPAVDVGARGTVYLGWQDGDQSEAHPYVAVSTNQGKTWSRSYDVGAAYGIKNVQFPAMVAGDDGRAAFAFLGSTSDGNDQAAAFAGTWRLYVATTYDAGKHWTTVDATPNELVQRGCIWLGGGQNNPCRNLLDFMGITVDREGRVLVGWADGCPAACERSAKVNPHSATPVISRQSAGRGLFAAYDGRL